MLHVEDIEGRAERLGQGGGRVAGDVAAVVGRLVGAAQELADPIASVRFGIEAKLFGEPLGTELFESAVDHQGHQTRRGR